MFNKGDLFLICDKGFDFHSKERINDISSVIHQTAHLPNNYLKYLEILDVVKDNRKRKYKCHFFMENKAATRGLWSMSSDLSAIDFGKEIYKTLSESIITSKLENQAITPSSWSDLAKDELLQENDT